MYSLLLAAALTTSATTPGHFDMVGLGPGFGMIDVSRFYVSAVPNVGAPGCAGPHCYNPNACAPCCGGGGCGNGCGAGCCWPTCVGPACSGPGCPGPSGWAGSLGANIGASPTRATVVVQLPADATLYINGKKSTQSASQRTIQTPDLDPQKEYLYNVKAEVVRDGKKLVKTQQIAFRAGQVVNVKFREATQTAVRDSVKNYEATLSATPERAYEAPAVLGED